jgi:hypothetical protein
MKYRICFYSLLASSGAWTAVNEETHSLIDGFKGVQAFEQRFPQFEWALVPAWATMRPEPIPVRAPIVNGQANRARQVRRACTRL